MPFRSTGRSSGWNLHDIIPNASRLAVISTLAVVAVALLIPLLSLGHWMMSRDCYQHFPLLLIAAVTLAVHRWRNQGVEFVGNLSLRSLLWIIAAVALTLVVFVLPSRWSAGLAAACLLIATAGFYGGRELTRLMLGPLMLVFAAIPLPVGLDDRLVVALQHLATWLSSLWLDLVGVMHLTTGVSIRTVTQDYFVEDACSGIHSVFAAIAVGVGYAAIRRYSLGRVVVLVGQLLAWVIIANALRVFLTVYGQSRLGLDLSSPAYHEVLGLITFAGGVLLAISGDHLIRYVRPLVDAECEAHAGGSVAAATDERLWFDRTLPGPLAASMAGGMTVVAIVIGILFFNYTAESGRAMSMAEMATMTVIDLETVSEDLLPEQLAGWQRSGFRTETRGPESNFGGMISLCWQYSNGSRAVLISLDGPYDDWHDLAVCYRGSGWDLTGMQSVDAGGVEHDPLVACELTLRRQPLESAQILYMCIDPQAVCVAPPPYYGKTVSSIVRRFGIGMQERPGFKGSVVQLQLMDTQIGEVSPQAKHTNMKLFQAAAEQVLANREARG